MEKFQIAKLTDLTEDLIKPLLEESKSDGFRFLKRLLDDYQSGKNKFKQDGEALFGVYTNNGILIAIGGLNQNPFSNEQKIGRVRRFYVLKDYRRHGIGKALIQQIIHYSQNYYDTLILHTDTDQGDKFYRALGFVKSDKYSNSTHYLSL